MGRQIADLNRGTLLVASPDTQKGFYHRSVLLVCEYTPNGSFGLVLNKPFTFELPQEIKNLEEMGSSKLNMRLGGSMQANQMMLLHESKEPGEHTLKIIEDVHLGGDLPFLQERLSSANCGNIFLFFGYTGWVAGELEKEYLSGLWYLYPASKTLIFQTPPEKLWQTTLQQMGGKYASISMIPEDLTLN